ncbi:MAG: hypothetical protein ACRENE_12990 [Polyangiaceae bacterium]
MNSKTKTRRIRVYTRLPAALRDRVASYCAASKISERAVFEAAVEQYLSSASDMTLVLRRLDRLGRADDRIHRDVELLSASFAVFVRLWFAHTPSLREEAKPAARDDAENRYQQFKDYVAQEFTGGRRFLDELPRDAIGDDAELTAMATNGDAPGGRGA